MSLKHVAIIMDGNGRFATSLGKIRSFGHLKGAKNIKNVIKFALSDRVETLSLFAFSTENWDRPLKEVQYLLTLLKKYVVSEKTLKFLMEHNIRFVWKGFKQKLDDSLISAIHELELKSQNNTALTLAIMFNYGGQAEIIHAVNQAVKNNETVDENSIKKYLITGDLPPVDLLIRTGGKQRISNFMLYNLSYAEIYFTDVYWPQFDKTEWNNALKNFKSTIRSFGKVL